MSRILLFSGILCFLLSCGNRKAASPGFIKVSGTGFIRNGKDYTFMGTNFWYGLNLGSSGPGGNRERLLRELDRLAAMGVKNLRIMGGSEGPDQEP
jgi:mannan endo-1,4-beta-mannosidase